MELQEQDSKAFEEIVSILQCHPEIEKFELAKEPILSLPGLEIYPSKRKVFRDRQEIQLTTKEYEILLLLVTHKGYLPDVSPHGGTMFFSPTVLSPGGQVDPDPQSIRQ